MLNVGIKLLMQNGSTNGQDSLELGASRDKNHSFVIIMHSFVDPLNECIKNDSHEIHNWTKVGIVRHDHFFFVHNEHPFGNIGKN
ncbi:hypothetical protein CEXT_117851 [Caerostris extrusa]|uniref:Uncharacterized protein n=1 Tax=Caerostris extrusa TaxID=172846 RepID=A0AAV4W0T8_CAEEX|nr:hypothetical protein CEXT_117851 [Caerostris extrusa]